MWRVIQPILIYYLAAIVTQNAIVAILLYQTSGTTDVISKNTFMITGVADLVFMLPAVWLYSGDHTRRRVGGIIPDQRLSFSGIKLPFEEILLLLGMGAALSQFGNILTTILNRFIQSTVYQDMMRDAEKGKSLLTLILWMGIIAPVAEEMLFRWLIFLRLRDWLRLPAAAVISGAVFGIFHGNVIQAIYAGILGMAFAYILELSGNLLSSIVLHMGANIWSLLVPVIAEQLSNGGIIPVFNLIYMLLLTILVSGVIYYQRKAHMRQYRYV